MGVSAESGEGAVAALPYVDEHGGRGRRRAGTIWEALIAVVEGSFAGAAPPRTPAPSAATTRRRGPRPLARGSTFPGFHVAIAEPGSELALAGSHRFSRYALIFRLDQTAPRAHPGPGRDPRRVPGPEGRLYRTLVIGTRAHVLVTRRLLGAVKARADGPPSHRIETWLRKR